MWSTHLACCSTDLYSWHCTILGNRTLPHQAHVYREPTHLFKVLHHTAEPNTREACLNFAFCTDLCSWHCTILGNRTLPLKHTFSQRTNTCSKFCTKHHSLKQREACLTFAVCKLNLEWETMCQGLNIHWSRNPPRPVGQAPLSGRSSLGMHSASLM